MSHTYLIDLYELIDIRLQRIESECKGDKSSGEDVHYLQGRTAALEDFMRFLRSGYDIKLPRRLRGKYGHAGRE